MHATPFAYHQPFVGGDSGDHFGTAILVFLPVLVARSGSSNAIKHRLHCLTGSAMVGRGELVLLAVSFNLHSVVPPLPLTRLVESTEDPECRFRLRMTSRPISGRNSLTTPNPILLAMLRAKLTAPSAGESWLEAVAKI